MLQENIERQFNKFRKTVHKTRKLTETKIHKNQTEIIELKNTMNEMEKKMQ